MLTLVADREEFAAERTGRQERAIDVLRPKVEKSLSSGEWTAVTAGAVQLFTAAAHSVDEELEIDEDDPLLQDMLAGLVNALRQTGRTEPGSHQREIQEDAISQWVAVMAINAGTEAAAARNRESVVLEWVSMEDDAVRSTHRVADGQLRQVGVPFDVAGYQLNYPGQPIGPPAIWIRCRCLAKVSSPNVTAAVVLPEDKEEPVAQENEKPTDPADLGPMKWNGVLAVEGGMSGDYRTLVENAVTWRDLPIPLRRVREDNGGHDGAVIVGRIDRIWRDGKLLRGEGVFDTSEEADEVLRLIAEQFLRGVSVDMDNVEVYADANPDSPEKEVVGRISAATLVAIPAFEQAYVALGPYEGESQEDDVQDSDDEPVVAAGEFAISEKPWDGDSSRFTLEQWCESTIISLEEGCESKNDHKLPILEPNGDLSRAGVYAAAARINQTEAPSDKISAAKATLRSAYEKLGEDPPEVIQASLETVQFVEIPSDVGIPGERGSGWITNTGDTSRLWQYWTDPGQPGYAKIGWGTPNDFYRCRRELAKYVEPQYLNATCAEWHHDALGVWPGQHSLNPEAAMVAAATFDMEKPKGAWFTDQNLPGPTALTVTDEGQVYGHIAEWGTCHIGIRGECVSPPMSANDYAYFHTGIIDTDEGEVKVGTLSMGGGHAGLNENYSGTVAHYDSTSTAAAYVHVGEDQYGIWMSGMVSPSMSDADRFALRAAGSVSGDWRSIGFGEPDLVAVLAVNVAGFAMPRMAIAASASRVNSMVALNPVRASRDDREVVALARRESKAHSKLMKLRASRAYRKLKTGEK